MSYVQGKSKNEILEAMSGTAQPGSAVHEQQKSAILVRCTEDIQVAFQEQSNATRKVNSSLVHLNVRIDSLEMAFKESSKSSSKVACALNWLTAALVLVGIAQVVVAYAK
ncbi:hypothetical protein [Marinobacter lutaoensis]|uniref:hypothetical protein n=1 Tax=Marinobacter lutaoensis TaxID=135739 RepID=UPI0015930B2D|nr:hypothetical protein [Marinobacter lutaoensis]NVD34387.1 hypothetical protein [Marinobacter lutaoensis]